MHRTHSEEALFTYVKDSKLQGLIATHSDDLIMAGNEVFEVDIERRLRELFEFSKVEKNHSNIVVVILPEKRMGALNLTSKNI